jgi:hypothetical protein
MMFVFRSLIRVAPLARPSIETTEAAWVIVIWQVPVPEHPAPDQPVNVEAASGLAVRATGTPRPNGTEHVDVQTTREVSTSRFHDPPRP